MVAFFGQGDSAFGHDHAAFGENQGAEAGDDLEKCAQVGRARVGAGGEFEKAQLELVFGELHQFGGGDARGGSVFGAGVGVVGDFVLGVNAAEGARAEFEAEELVGFGAGLLGVAFFGQGDEGVDLVGG